MHAAAPPGHYTCIIYIHVSSAQGARLHALVCGCRGRRQKKPGKTGNSTKREIQETGYSTKQESQENWKLLFCKMWKSRIPDKPYHKASLGLQFFDFRKSTKHNIWFSYNECMKVAILLFCKSVLEIPRHCNLTVCVLLNS